jgi:hypothetical protein
MPGATIESDIEQLRERAAAFDRPETSDWVDAVVDNLRRSEDACDPGVAASGLSALRRNRWFDLVLRLAEALITAEVDDVGVHRHYAQALIDTGRPVAAAAVIQQALAKLPADHPEQDELFGLRGRCFKDMYIASEAPGFERNRRLLRMAIESYKSGYEFDRVANRWLGINLAALADRARRDGVPLDEPVDPVELADQVLSQIEPQPVEQLEPWDFATAAEACVAKGDLDGAGTWLSRYVESDVGSFELTGTLRQLETVWQEGSSARFSEMLDLLRSAILSRQDGGSVVLEPQRATGLEKVLGTTGVKTLTWYRTGLSKADSVARVCDANGSTVGTAFLAEGKSLSDRLPADELFALTNAHVISESDSGALFPDEAWLGFEAAGLDAVFPIDELVFTSPPNELDVSILRLQRRPPGLSGLAFQRRLPTLGADTRVYVVGHPQGGGLSYSLQDNLLLDLEVPRLHYRAPTEPGSSGSPVFDDQWRLLAIHHAGGLARHRLNGGEGTYAANEGISILSITRALDAFLAG